MSDDDRDDGLPPEDGVWQPGVWEPGERDIPPVEDWSGLGEDLLSSADGEGAEAEDAEASPADVAQFEELYPTATGAAAVPSAPAEPAEPPSLHDIEPEPESAEPEPAEPEPAPAEPELAEPAPVPPAAPPASAAQQPSSETMGGTPLDAVQMPDAAANPFSVTFSGKQIERVRELLTRLYALRRGARFYPAQHPALAEAVRSLFEVVTRYHGEGVDVPIAFFEGEVFLGERFLPEDSVLFDQLIRDMASLGAGSITFARGLTQAELVRAMPVLGSDYAEVKAAGGIEAMAAAANIPHVLVGAVTVIEQHRETEQVEDKELAKEAYGGAIELLRELDRVIRTNKAVSAGQVKGVVRSLVDNVLTNRYAMLELTGLKNYDEYTFFHSANVAILSLALGSQVTSDYRFLSSLGVGALMHDIGKLSIDLGILNKPGSLTSEEWALVRQHPVFGAETAAGMPGLDKSAVVVILEHHMRYDLTGYPTRVPPRRQHLASRIVSVADAYDAMTSRRSYSAARLQDEGMSLLAKNSGSAFDPTLVRLFITLMGVYPPRSVVRLSDDSTAIVLGPSEADVLRPNVRVIADPGSAMVEPFDVDLSDLRAAEGRTIVQCLDQTGMNVEVDDFL
ncbi:MAG: HD-GYP domain-containing protein [Actinobacteria bacterium]|nr:MAG: HD-GYP domain-containing protein [Actinomycetota bacterium]